MPTIERWIERHAAERPQQAAVAWRGGEMSYAELWRAIGGRADRLRADGRRCVVLRATPTVGFIIDYFAIHDAGKVAVPLDSHATDDAIASAEAQLDGVAVDADAADILFTTGTTGKSKGVVISRGAIVANAENLVDGQGYHSGITFVIAGPLNHLGSLSKIYPVMMAGGTIVITEGVKDVNAFFEAFDQPSRRFATFLVPAALRMLMALSAERLHGLSAKLEFVETGAAPMSQADMERLCALLPHSRLYNTYASTETGIVSTHNFNSGKCVAGCLGKPLRNSTFWIDGQGNVACSGKTVMLGYVGDTAACDGTVHTSDQGFIDADGMLNLTGREGDIINVGGYKVAPSEVEDAAMALADVADCVCVAEEHPVVGTMLKLLVVTAEGRALDKRAIARQLAETLPREKVPMLYERVEEVKRTYNGKIDRKAYRKQ